jgi:hypothetical protein
VLVVALGLLTGIASSSCGARWWTSAYLLGGSGHASMGGLIGVLVAGFLLVLLAFSLLRGRGVRYLVGATSVSYGLVVLFIIGPRSWPCAVALLVLGASSSRGAGAANVTTLFLLGMLASGVGVLRHLFLSSGQAGSAQFVVAVLLLVELLISGYVVLWRVGVLGTAWLLEREAWLRGLWSRGGKGVAP